MKAATFFSILLIFFCCNPVEDGWKGIRPLRTNFDQVSKSLGKGKTDSDGNFNFVTEDASIHAIFSSAPCTEAGFGRGDYNVPERTILNYVVHMKKLVKFTDLDLDRENYVRDASGDVINSFTYVNKKDGVWISVRIRDDIEYVGTIYYWPTEKDKEKFKCPRANEKRLRGWGLAFDSSILD